MKSWLLILAWSAIFLTQSAFGEGIGGSVALEARHFPEAGAYAGQKRDNISIALSPTYDRSWENGRQTLTFEAFFRVDSGDSKRTHFDIRELSFKKYAGGVEYEVGVGNVYWGVTESQHLVDVIGQVDFVESFSREAKLGQPLARVSLLDTYGDLHFYALPLFRERNFAGPGGRFSGALEIDTDNPIFESPSGNQHVDFALRWEKQYAFLDIGLSHFYGTSRDPHFTVDTKDGATVLRPTYRIINQSSLDLQATLGPLLIKQETIYRNFKQKIEGDFYAQTTGVEYTFYAVSAATDLGLLVEVMSNSKPGNSLSLFGRGLFAGTRFAFNDVSDSSLLVGVVTNLDSKAKFITLEGSRRFMSDYRLKLEAGVFTDIPEDSSLAGFRKDSYVQIDLQRFF